MIAHLNDISQLWWQWMGSMFWQVSLLIILVTALDMAIRKWAWPQVRYALWALVFIKLIIPPTWQMPTSIVSRIQPQVEEQMSIQIGRVCKATDPEYNRYRQLLPRLLGLFAKPRHTVFTGSSIKGINGRSRQADSVKGNLQSR